MDDDLQDPFVVSSVTARLTGSEAFVFEDEPDPPEQMTNQPIGPAETENGDTIKVAPPEDHQDDSSAADLVDSPANPGDVEDALPAATISRSDSSDRTASCVAPVVTPEPAAPIATDASTTGKKAATVAGRSVTPAIDEAKTPPNPVEHHPDQVLSPSPDARPQQVEEPQSNAGGPPEPATTAVPSSVPTPPDDPLPAATAKPALAMDDNSAAGADVAPETPLTTPTPSETRPPPATLPGDALADWQAVQDGSNYLGAAAASVWTEQVDAR